MPDRPKQTTIRARQAAANNERLSRNTGFKPRPRLNKDQSGKSTDARLVLAIRVQNHWTQERLGAELGVDRSTIARWEADQVKPPTLYVATLQGLLAS